MAKKVDPAKAKQAKQKKMAIGLSVLFAAVLAYQVPKTMKMLKGPSAAVATEAAPVPVAPAATTPGAPLPVPGAPVPAAGAPAPAAAQPAVLVDSDLPVQAGEGQLLSFELFESQDPFVQQVDASAPAAGGGAPAAESGDPAPKPGSTAAKPTGSIVPVTESAPGATPGSAKPSGPSEPSVPPATTTTIALNDTEVEFATDGSFPAEEPIFVLVSIADDGKSVEIGIAGGAYADGDETITLKIGKPLTLQNTADGSRYELELLTVAGHVPPKPKS